MSTRANNNVILRIMQYLPTMSCFLAVLMLVGCTHTEHSERCLREDRFQNVVWCLYREQWKQIERNQQKYAKAELKRDLAEYYEKKKKNQRSVWTEDEIRGIWSMVPLFDKNDQKQGYCVNCKRIPLKLTKNEKGNVTNADWDPPIFFSAGGSPQCSDNRESFGSQRNNILCRLLYCSGLGDNKRDYNTMLGVDHSETLLMMSAAIGDKRLAKWLIDHGADPNKQTGPFILDDLFELRPNMTALHYAAILKNREFYDYLVQRGGDENKKDALGRTPKFYLTHHLTLKEIWDEIHDKAGTDLHDCDR